MRGDAPTSPYRFYQESGVADGSLTIWADVYFDPVTRVLANNPAMRVTRLATCPWNALLIGDGSKIIPIQAGTSSLNRAQMNAQGFTTLDDILGYTITLTTV